MSTSPSSSRSRRRRPPPPDTSNDSPFRSAERYWKSRTSSPELERALSVEAIVWDDEEGVGQGEGGRRGVWRGGGRELVCWKVGLGEMEGMGQSKGEAAEPDYAVVIPAIPGLVLLPSLLPPPLQRLLTIESLRHSVLPNLTSLSAHYELPQTGLWASWEAGRGAEVVPPAVVPFKGTPRRTRVDFEPVTKENWKEVGGRGAKVVREEDVSEGFKEESEAEAAPKEVTVADLLPRLRWTTIGWSYNWTSKTYDFDRPKTPLPPLTYRCCRDVVRAIPWERVFGATASIADVDDSVQAESEDWRRWSDEYEPEAGVFNFYQLRDSLTAHVDQSEVDAVRPLVSFSLGQSAIFLVGGPTRDTPPLAIRLDSGDGLIMSGHRGRRVFHGLPRVIADSLPAHLAPEVEREEGEEKEGEWRLFGEYLQAGARINVNVRAVF